MTFLISLITSLTGSFLIARFYLNWQYHKSNAGFRQERIIKATTEIIVEYRENKVFPGELVTKHFASFGNLIPGLLSSFGDTKSANKTGTFPLLAYRNESDSWKFYFETIKPVMTDLNNNSFMGWFEWVPNVKKLKTLWEICFTVEDIISDISYLRGIEKKENIHLFSILNEYEFEFTRNQLFQKETDLLKAKYNHLQSLWYNWLILTQKNVV